MAYAYAQGTEVSADRSKADIERTLRRFGAKNFAYGWSDEEAAVGFTIGGMTVRIALPLPGPQDREFSRTPTGRSRTAKQADEAYEAECRRRWRSLAAVIKAKLVAVGDNISTIEKEFLAFILLPNGQTVGEYVSPQLAKGEALPLLPSPRRALGTGQ